MSENSTDFTGSAWESLYGVIEDPYFRRKNASLIYEALDQNLKVVPFCMFLKRYIYRRAGLTGDINEIQDDVYYIIIRDSFKDNHTPRSFAPTSAKFSQLAGNWLTQYSAKRSTVFLLGFGLKMSLEDVEVFLVKVLREQSFDKYDPFEVICRYCFQNRFGFPKYDELNSKFESLSPNDVSFDALQSHTEFSDLTSEDKLMEYLAYLKFTYSVSHSGNMLIRQYAELFEKAKEKAAVLMNTMEVDSELISSVLSDSPVKKKHYSADMISAGDIEKLISAAVPVDKSGNLISCKKSKLNLQFSGKRFSRQRVNEILNSVIKADRFDFIILNFFIISQTKFASVKDRYMAFIDTSNEILEKAGFGKLYVVNPYECFLMMCSITPDPLETYSDVIEKSYRKF